MSSDPILANAVQRRDAAAAEMRRWDEFIAMYRELAGEAAAPARVGHEVFEAMSARARQASEVGSSKGALAETETAAVLAIEEAKRPLHTRELLDALTALGIEVGGKDPASTLSARLSRASRIENVRPHGWRIKESPQGDGAAGDLLPSNPAAPGPTSNSADEDGREVVHDNTDLDDSLG